MFSYRFPFGDSYENNDIAVISTVSLETDTEICTNKITNAKIIYYKSNDNFLMRKRRKLSHANRRFERDVI